MKSFKFTIEGVQYDVDVKSVADNIAHVEVNGTNFEVEIQRQVPVTKTPILVRDPVRPPEAPKTTVQAGFTKVRSPLPGNILSVIKKNGDKVTRGELVLTYEAMKMENRILAEKDGIVRELAVSPGDTIVQDQVLFEIE
ncbi:MAG: biotin/lipoyl-containing protein [Bacteroidales bacterium]